MSLPAPQMLTGTQRSAALMRALGPNGQDVWANLTAGEARTLSEAMDALPDGDAVERIAVDSLKNELSETAAPQPAPSSFWYQIGQLPGTRIAGAIDTESPQVVAVILSRLKADTAAATVKTLPRDLATEALRRLLALGQVQPVVLSAIERSLSHLIETPSARTHGRNERVAEIFDNLDESSNDHLLNALDQIAPGSRERIRALMFTFEDLAQLDPASLQTLLANTSRETLMLSLRHAKPEISAAIFKNMTQRAGDAMKAEIEALGDVRRSDVTQARAEILSVARTLAKRGDILAARADEDDLVA